MYIQNYNMVKSIATGVASNMAGYFTASTILNHIPFVNILSAPVMYAATCIQGFIYIKILTVITSTDKDSVDGVIARVINENSSLIKQLLKEILGLGTKSQTRTAVSLAVLSRRRQGEANKIKQNTSKLIKYIAITAVLSYAGISYCSYNDAYTRGVTDLWITSMTRTDWNVWWYLWGLIAIISALSFVIVTYSCCFGYAEYFKIKSTPLSSFAKSDEYLSDDCNLEHIIKEEVRCKKWNKCVILLSHIIMVLISAFIAYLCYNYCSFNESSQMIEVKYLFMDASMENDTNYVWYIIAACGIVSVTFGVYNIYMFVKGLFSK